jgi:sulfide:quinone oxidoreductase
MLRVLVCGGGVAASEALLRLRKLAGDEVSLTALAPNDEMVYRPTAVREPFAGGGARRYPLAAITEAAGAEVVKDRLASVDLERSVVRTEQDSELPFDALLVAVGARFSPPFRHARVFTDSSAAMLQGLVQDIEEGYSHSVAFVVPDGPSWPLPIYELALMTRERASSMGVDDLEIILAVPEPKPLVAFGDEVSAEVTRLLDDANVTLYCSTRPSVPESQQLLLQPPGVLLRPERIVTLPHMSGPDVHGLPGGTLGGFVPIDGTCAVPGTDGRVFAAGDGADFPIKHGGIGAQEADVAASHIARLAGVDVEPEIFRPHIAGTLLTGGKPLYVEARVVGNRGFQGEIHETPPWPEDAKIVAVELGPFLETVEPLHS